MGTFLIVLSVIWFVMALVFTLALAAAGRRQCSEVEVPANAFAPQIASVRNSQTPPLLFGALDAIQPA
jgi:hypothetical protein